jgi:hypothetical protein
MFSKTTKIVLGLCILGVAHSAYALELMDNDAMSASTGQDGLTITLKDFAPNMRLNWIDTNGVNATDNVLPDRTLYGFNAPASAGVVMFGDGTTAGNFRISQSDIVLKLDTDAGNGAPFLNLNIQLPQQLTINTGDIFVAGERQADGSYANPKKIMRNMTVEMGDGSGQGLGLTIQLGNSPLSHFLTISGTIKQGIRVSNLGIISETDVGNNEFGIGMAKMTIRDTHTQDLTFSGATVDLTNRGLIFTPSANKKINVLMQDLKFGNLDTGQGIGDIALSNLAIGNNTITIVGH